MKYAERRKIIEILRKRFGGQTVDELRCVGTQGATMDVGQWWCWNVRGASKSKGVTVLGGECEDGWTEVIIPWAEIAKGDTYGQMDIFDLVGDDND